MQAFLAGIGGCLAYILSDKQTYNYEVTIVCLIFLIAYFVCDKKYKKLIKEDDHD